MKCTRLTIEGLPVIVCGSGWHDDGGPCEFCAEPGTLLCDWILKKPAGRDPALTCDKRLCAAHGLEVAENKHLCPTHQAGYAQWKAQREARAPAGSAP
jgi:hypothetical protein